MLALKNTMMPLPVNGVEWDVWKHRKLTQRDSVGSVLRWGVDIHPLHCM